ncbi:hypothetical protein ACGFS9_21235 [Streptomyces sp. NPDC048566]|uniref:hypothetical protein n=1 Tax=Streptomyces sp. NPDC048566 TaxID=3365569 RepID=UPI003721588B
MATRTAPASSAPALGVLAVDPTDIAALWASARATYLARTFPPYGSPAWLALHPDDPTRFAATIDAAEKWRKYGDEEGLIRWFREAHHTRPPITSRRTLAENDAAMDDVRRRAAEMWERERAALVPNPRWPQVTTPGQEIRA